MSTIQIDDPAIKVIALADTESAKVRLRRLEMPFNSAIKVNRVRSLLKKSPIAELTAVGDTPQITLSDDFYEYDFDASLYGTGVVYDHIDGYGTGSRQLTIKWIINKTGK